jgi:hypothetical protein
MGSKSKGRQTDDYLKQQAMAAQSQANTAIAKAETPDPLEQRRRDYVTRILDWREGKLGPIDVRNFPDQTAIALYNDAKTSHDAGRIGKGYGTLADGTNPNFSTALDKETQMERDLAASGELENYIGGQLASADAETGNLWAAGDARNMNIASMLNNNYNSSQDRWVSYLMRPKQPGFLKSLALGAIGNFKYTPSGGALGIAGLAI